MKLYTIIVGIGTIPCVALVLAKALKDIIKGIWNVVHGKHDNNNNTTKINVTFTTFFANSVKLVKK